MTRPRANVERVMIGLVAGLIVGMIIRSSSSTFAHDAVGWITPLGTLWINAVRMTIVPLVIALLFAGVADAGAGEALSREGISSFITFAALLLLAALIAMLLAPALMHDLVLDPDAVTALRASLAQSAKTTADEVAALPGFGSWLAGLAPANVFRAAADGAMLPLIVFTVLFGLAARTIAEPHRVVLVAFFRAIGEAMTTVVAWVIYAAPVGVFALVLVPASTQGSAFAGAVGYYIISLCALLVLFVLLLYPVAHLSGFPIRIFAGKVFPAQAVALASSSSLASLPALIEGANDLEIGERVSGFVLPLSVATFKVAAPITWTVGALFVAKLYGVYVSGPTAVAIALTGAAASFSIPGVPQGSLLLLAPVLASFGIPPQGVGILLAADTIPDLVGTMVNVTGDLVATTVVARVATPKVDETESDEETLDLTHATYNDLPPADVSDVPTPPTVEP